MSSDDDNYEPFDWGDHVRILGSKVTGFVTAVTFWMRKEPTYWVEYIDANGSPTDREWSESQLQLIGKAAAQDADDLAEEASNVIPFARSN